MSHARWRSSTAAASIRPLSEEARSARDQTLAERLKQRPSLLSTDAASAAEVSPDGREARCRSPRRDDSALLMRSSTRRHSSTGVASDPASWQLSRKPSRQSSTTPRSAERRRSRYSDIKDLEERISVARCESEKKASESVEPPLPPPRAAARTSTRGLIASNEPSQPAFSESNGSSQAVSASNMSPSQSVASPRDPPSKADRTPMSRQSDRSPARNPAREFQVKPRREPEQEPQEAKESDDIMNSKVITSSIPPIVRKTLMDFDRIQKLKTAAERAIRDKKVFMIHGGYPSIRLALKRRGWVEKKYLINRQESEDDIDVSRWPIDNNDSVTIGLAEVLSLKGSKNSMIMTRLLRDHQPNLIWSAKREVIDFINLDRDQLVNHFPRAPFNTKIGLCSLAQGLHWFSESLPSLEFIPRAYRIGMAEEKQDFVDDFRLTACVSLLVWFRERYELHGPAGVEDSDGEVPYSVIPTALQQCQAFIAVCQHEDIEPSAFNRALWPHQWDNFMTNVYKVLHKKKKLEMHRDENSTIVKVFYNRIMQLLKDLEQYRPQTRLDGCLNIWIVKPGSASRGRGIILLRHLEDILALVDSATQREGKWVVQKYCERPLLIYNTKFDIRQWFLVTDWNPLTVWMYKQSYLRFSSQQFNLDDLKEAIHLCNNAVQCRYRNGERHAALPTENMWDCSTFQQFLKTREAGHAWDQIIYPGMKNAFISLCLATQAELEPRKGCFELYGADFMLTEDYHPWLIEVNSSPAMGASTSVTAWLCAMCLEDTIRVIVDRRKDVTADVGEFECIMQQPPVSSPRYLGIDLSLHGHRIKPPPVQPPPPQPLPYDPPTPRVPISQSSSTVRDTGSRLNSIPASQSTPAASRQRSRSQAPTAAAAAATAGGKTAGPAQEERQRRRSQSQAAPAAAKRTSISTTVTPPGKAAATAAAAAATPQQRARQKPAKKQAAMRRRSRTQVIQSSVRRLSAPRRSRSNIKQKMAQVAGVNTPPQKTSSTLVRPAASVPRNPLEISRRQLPAPRAQQLVTAGEQLLETTTAAGGQRAARPATEAARLSTPASEPRVTGSARSRPRSVTLSADCLPDGATGGTDKPAAPSRPSPDSVGQAGSHFLNSSLDKLERIKQASEEAVRRISSFSASPAPGRVPAAEASGSRAVQGTSVEVVGNKTQLAKVRWMAMPTVKPATASKPGSSATDAATAAAQSSPQTGRSASPTGRAAVPSPRARSPSAGAGTPPVPPRTASPATRAEQVTPPAASSPRLSSISITGRSIVPASPALSWGSPVTAGRTPEDAVSASDSWHTPEESPSRPATVGARLLPPLHPSHTDEGSSSAASRGVGLPPARALSSSPVRLQRSPRSQQLQQQAYNNRINELKGLIDRAIEETREFLGRSRSQPRPDAMSHPLVDLLQPQQQSPRPLLSPTIVDISVNRPAGSPREAVWERRSDPGDMARSGAARFSPRRPVYQWRPPGTSPTPPTPGSPRATARLTELVGLQGRRFLPSLGAPEPAPRRGR